MKITGNVICYDRSDLCQVLTDSGQTATVDCIDTSINVFESSGFVVGKTTWTTSDSTFSQGQLLDPIHGLTKTFLDRRYQGWTQVDGTYVDGTYTEPRLYDPISISYGIYYQYDGTHWNQQGYRFRDPMNPAVGSYYANMVAPQTVGLHRIEWLYRKDQSSYSTIDNQTFHVVPWGSTPYTAADMTGSTPIVVQAIPAYQTKNIGENAVFSIIITGNIPAPVLTYQWQREGVSIAEGGKFSGTQTPTLLISNASKAESGQYQCIVSAIVASNIAWLSIDP